ncbi:hypothetical protein ES708_10371 [subsurface metagenome]
METRIGEFRDYGIFYDSRNKKFILKDSEGEEVASGKTQDEVEAQAEKIAKAAFKFPIPALVVEGDRTYAGKITSLNIDDKSCIFSYDGSHPYHSRTKIRLSHQKAYPLTRHNGYIHKEIAGKMIAIERLQEQIRDQTKLLEKPIDAEFFGLKSGF